MKRYPGLSPFEANQKDVFFGRDTDIKELSKLIYIERKVLLYSKSGYGKTSLLNAGVIPELRKNEEFEFIDIRFTAYNTKNPPPSPDFAFKQAVLQHSDFKATTGNDTLIDTYAKDYLNEYWCIFKKNQLQGNIIKTYVLVFDQFEELFTYPEEQIEAFKNRFTDIITDNKLPSFIKSFEKLLFANKSGIDKEDLSIFYQPINIKAIFAIRSDRLSELNYLADKMPDIQKVFYELQPLSKEQAKQAIEKPALQEGEFESQPFTYESTAIDKIINALTDNGKQKIESTQLQIVCQRIEENLYSRDARPCVSASDIPDFRDIFLNFYIDAIAKVQTDPPQTVQKFIEDQLIIEGRRISLDQYVCQRHVTNETLETLVKTRLLRAERNSVEGFSYELSHDTLVPPIKELAEKRREKEKEAHTQAERVEEILRLKEKQKKDRRKFVLVLLILLFALGLSGVAFWQMRRANIALKEVELKNKTIDSTLTIVVTEKEKNNELFLKANQRKREAEHEKASADTARNKAEQSELYARALLGKSNELLNVFLPGNIKDIYQYFVNKADSFYQKGNYTEALRNYKLAKNAVGNSINQNDIRLQEKTIHDIQLNKEHGIKYIRNREYAKAFKLFEDICKINPGDFESKSFMSLCNLFANEIFPIDNYTLDYGLSKNEITNLQYASFLNDYRSDFIKSGDYSGELMIKEHKWGLKKVNNKWVPQTGYDNYPVVNVSWYGAHEFTSYYGFELPPIEAFKEIIQDTAYFYNCWNQTNSGMHTHVVGERYSTIDKQVKHNDFLGNVWEWCSLKTNIKNNSERIIIGGSYATPVLYYDKEKKTGNMLYLNQAVTKATNFNSSIGFRITKK